MTEGDGASWAGGISQPRGTDDFFKVKWNTLVCWYNVEDKLEDLKIEVYIYEYDTVGPNADVIKKVVAILKSAEADSDDPTDSYTGGGYGGGYGGAASIFHHTCLPEKLARRSSGAVVGYNSSGPAHIIYRETIAGDVEAEMMAASSGLQWHELAYGVFGLCGLPSDCAAAVADAYAASDDNVGLFVCATPLAPLDVPSLDLQEQLSTMVMQQCLSVGDSAKCAPQTPQFELLCLPKQYADPRMASIVLPGTAGAAGAAEEEEQNLMYLQTAISDSAMDVSALSTLDWTLLARGVSSLCGSADECRTAIANVAGVVLNVSLSCVHPALHMAPALVTAMSVAIAASTSALGDDGDVTAALNQVGTTYCIAFSGAGQCELADPPPAIAAVGGDDNGGSSGFLPGSAEPPRKSRMGLIVGLAFLGAILAAAAAFFAYRNQWFGLCANSNNKEKAAVQQELKEAEAQRNTVGMEANPLARQSRSAATTVNPTFIVAGADAGASSTNGGGSVGAVVYMEADPKQPDVYDNAKENQNTAANAATSIEYAVPMQAAAASSAAPVYATYASSSAGRNGCNNGSNGNRNMDVNGYQIDGYYDDAATNAGSATDTDNGVINRNMDINGYQIDGYYDDAAGGGGLNGSTRQDAAQAEQRAATATTASTSTSTNTSKSGDNATCARGNSLEGGRACRNRAIPNSEFCTGHTCKKVDCFSTKSSSEEYCLGHCQAATDC
eukprot:gene17195-19216_t